MPLTSIEIEQVAAEQWVAKIEVGGMICKRRTVTAPSHEAILAATGVAYRDMAGIPEPDPLPPLRSPTRSAERLPPLRDVRSP